MNEPIYNVEEAVNYIAKRCAVNKETIENILDLELDYMVSIGLATIEE